MNKTSQGGRRRLPTSEYRRWVGSATSIEIDRRLVTLSKSKIYCLPLIFLFLEIEIS